MCRHLAWLGAPRTLAELVLQPEHSLLVQSWAPRRQAHGLMNADGWGVGFYAPGATGPARWRSCRPLWADPSFASVAPVIRSGCVLAAVRSATVGMPIEESSTAPFQHGDWLLSHNGRVDRDVLPVSRHAESACDSAILAAHLVEQGMARVAATIRSVAASDPLARLNILATDGTQIIATTWGDTLSTLRTTAGIVVASEPFDDDPSWTDVPDHHLLHVTDDKISLCPLDGR